MTRARVRYLALLVVSGFVTGCAGDVMMVNPRTRETAICRESLRGLNPWSQQEACVGDHIARGWTRVPGN